jgi:twitching motility protein PilI
MSKYSPGYLKLAQYYQQAFENAKPLPAQSDTGPKWGGIGFSLNNKKYLLPINDLDEVLQIPRMTQVPGVKPWVRGIANVRGRLMTIIDLQNYITSTPSKDLMHKRMLVIDKQDMYCGVIVDKVLGMQHFDEEAYSDQLTEDLGRLNPCVAGTFKTDFGMWMLLEIRKFISLEDIHNLALG